MDTFNLLGTKLEKINVTGIVKQRFSVLLLLLVSARKFTHLAV